MLDTAANEMMDASTHHVFVYGTLRQGDDNDINLLKPTPFFVGSSNKEFFNFFPLYLQTSFNKIK